MVPPLPLILPRFVLLPHVSRRSLSALKRYFAENGLDYAALWERIKVQLLDRLGTKTLIFFGHTHTGCGDQNSGNHRGEGHSTG